MYPYSGPHACTCPSSGRGQVMEHLVGTLHAAGLVGGLSVASGQVLVLSGKRNYRINSRKGDRVTE